MQHQEGTFKGIRDATIYYQSWLPEGETKAILLIVHGLAEHSGRYMNVVNHFVPLGYAVYGVGQRRARQIEWHGVQLGRSEEYMDFESILTWYAIGSLKNRHSWWGTAWAPDRRRLPTRPPGRADRCCPFWTGRQSARQRLTGCYSCGQVDFSLDA